jgi:hypothetical protein
MYIIKDPSWYLENQKTPNKVYSNLIFLFISLYIFYKDKLLSGLFFLLFLGSSLFHINSNKITLTIDRITMVLVFSYFFHLFYKEISFQTYIVIGLFSIYYWFIKDNLLPYFLYQLFGLVLFFIYTPIDLVKKIIIIIMYIFITYSQLFKRGKYHSLKHIGLGLLSLLVYNLVATK